MEAIQASFDRLTSENPMGEARKEALRAGFDSQIKLEFHGAAVTSDAGRVAYRELDEALGLTAMADELFRDPRRGMNTQHALTALLRQSVYSRLAGYTIRLKSNAVLERQIKHFLTRPVGRPPKKPVVRYHDFTYQAASARHGAVMMAGRARQNGSRCDGPWRRPGPLSRRHSSP